MEHIWRINFVAECRREQFFIFLLHNWPVLSLYSLSQVSDIPKRLYSSTPVCSWLNDRLNNLSFTFLGALLLFYANSGKVFCMHIGDPCTVPLAPTYLCVCASLSSVRFSLLILC